MTGMMDFSVVNQTSTQPSQGIVRSLPAKVTKWAFLLTLAFLVAFVSEVPAQNYDYNEDEDIRSPSRSSRSSRRSSDERNDGHIQPRGIDRLGYEESWEGRPYERNRDRRRDTRSERSAPTSTNSGASSTAKDAAIVTGDAKPNVPGQANVQPPGVQPHPGMLVNPPGVNKNPGRPGVMQGANPGGGQNVPAAPAPTVKRGFPTFYFEPGEPHVKTGEEFDLNLVISNDQKAAFDTLAVVVRYNLEALEVLDLNEEQAGINIKDATDPRFALNRSSQAGYTNWVDKDNGIIYYGAKVQGAPLDLAGVFATIRFKALAPTRTPCKLEFLMTPQKDAILSPKVTALSLEGKDVLGYEAGQGGGAVSARVRVMSPDEELNEPIIDSSLLAGTDTGDKPLPTWLLMVPDRKEVKVGEEFNIEVLLYNPVSTPVSFDRISLYLKYDPSVMEITSLDKLVRGTQSTRLRTNSDFGFDQTEQNNVDVMRGIIDYQARSTKNTLSGSGRVLTLSFKALKPVDDARLLVGFSQRDKAPTTGLFDRKMDRLGDPKVAVDSVFTTGVKVTASSGA